MSTSAMPIDTQHMVSELTAAGIAQAHAGAIASVIAGTVERHHVLLLETVCSRCDFDLGVAKLDAKIDEVAARLDAKIDAVAARLDAKIDAVAARLDAKIDAVAARLDAKIDAVDAKIDNSIAKLKADLIMWIVSAGLFQSGLIAALLLGTR